MMAESNRFDCIVVGGGMLGMLTARGLKKAGLDVAILERGDPGRESSWAGGGILSPLVPWRYPDAISELVIWSQRYYPCLIEELLHDTGIDAEWVQSGMLLLNMQIDPDIRHWADKYASVLETVSPAWVGESDPEIVLAREDSILLPEVAQIRNPLLCTALAQSLHKQGIEFLEQTEVTGLDIASGRIRGVQTSKAGYHADRVVIASGAWSSRVMQLAGLDLAVEPVRGQMVMFETRPGLLRHITLHEDYYLIPRQNGLVLVGSTLEYTGFNKETTPEARQLLIERATSLAPVLADYEVIRHWAGLRPGTSDGIPFIGKHPGIDGLYVNAGHFRNGVVMAPASAQLLVDIMLERDSFTAIQPYSL
jgi:glycine oxidase